MDDDALVERASQGDAAAVDGLLAQYLPGLIGFVRKRAADLLAVESSADIVQSVFREVLGDLADGRLEYRGEGEFRAWLHEAALFKIRNRRRYWRAERRDRARVLPQAADASAPGVEDLARTTRTPSREAAGREEAARLAALLDRLPERHREIVRLARFEGLPHREIAARLGISEEASRQLLNRALARLATIAAARDED